MTDDDLQKDLENDCSQSSTEHRDPLFKILMAELKSVNDLDDAAIKRYRHLHGSPMACYRQDAFAR